MGGASVEPEESSAGSGLPGTSSSAVVSPIAFADGSIGAGEAAAGVFISAGSELSLEQPEAKSARHEQNTHVFMSGRIKRGSLIGGFFSIGAGSARLSFGRYKLTSPGPVSQCFRSCDLG